MKLGARDCHSSPWCRVGQTHTTARVCDRFEKEDKCWSVSKANGFLRQTALMIFCVQELKGEDAVKKKKSITSFSCTQSRNDTGVSPTWVKTGYKSPVFLRTNTNKQPSTLVVTPLTLQSLLVLFTWQSFRNRDFLAGRPWLTKVLEGKGLVNLGEGGGGRRVVNKLVLYLFEKQLFAPSKT